METLLSQAAPQEPVAATGENTGADAALAVRTQPGENTAIVNTTEPTGLRTAANSLLDRILEFQSNGADDFGNLAALTEGSFPTIHAGDLPSPAFHDDDLPVPLFHDDDLPAPSLHEHDLPADLTTMGLNRLLGLQLSAVDLPTVGEATRAVFRSANPIEAEPEDAETTDDDGEPPVEEDEASPHITNAGDLSFIDPASLTEQAESNSANPLSASEFEIELFGTDILFPDSDDVFADDIYDPGGSEFLPTEEEGGGGGTNVINGTAGNDNLVGTTGDDLIHGFAGNDFIDGGAGSDRLDGGQGNDVLVWDSADTWIDGKNGTDTVRVDSATADFTSFGGSISGIEFVDLQAGVGAYNLTLTAQDVLDVTDGANILTVTGDAADSVDASNGWTYGGVDGGGNDIYTQVVGADTATLIVDPNITVNANILL